jgi:hypothetical protein
MVEIDWGDLTPTRLQRARAEARVGELSDLEGPVVLLRRRGGGYEAQLRTLSPAAPAELRLHGDDLSAVVDRAVHLLSIVVRESSRLHQSG